MVWYIAACVIFIGIGLFLLLKPELWWRLTERWKSYYADEPSDLFLISTRFGGVLFTIFGVVMLVLPLFLD